MFLTKTKAGYFIPSDEKSQDEAKKISIGEEVKATKARNVKFHRKSFALLNLGFSNQDKYENFEVYRKIITIKAGFFDEVEGKDGHTYYIPRSLSFDSMSAEDFELWYEATLNVIANELETNAADVDAEINSFF